MEWIKQYPEKDLVTAGRMSIENSVRKWMYFEIKFEGGNYIINDVYYPKSSWYASGIEFLNEDIETGGIEVEDIEAIEVNELMDFNDTKEFLNLKFREITEAECFSMFCLLLSTATGDDVESEGLKEKALSYHSHYYESIKEQARVFYFEAADISVIVFSNFFIDSFEGDPAGNNCLVFHPRHFMVRKNKMIELKNPISYMEI